MQVYDDPANHRFIAETDTGVAGYTVYHQRGGRYFFVHTEVSKAFEGQGLGSALARFALDDVRAKGLYIIPLCPFIAGFINRHPDYKDLVDSEMLATINGPPPR